jgi:hypothetical protein
MNKKYDQGRALFCTVALILMSAITFTGRTDAQNTGKTRQGLAAKKVRLWTENNNVIPVCWETYGYDREKDIVQAAVTQTWGEYADLKFTGWGICPSGGISGSATEKQVRIRLSPQGKDKNGRYINAGGDGVSRFGMEALSSAVDQNPGISMSFAPDGSADKGRVEYVGVHEFGHTLGFIHEQDAPNHNAAHCTGSTDANATSLTNYDPDSVMNYCNRDGNMKGYLTVKDINGVIKIYGASKAKAQNFWRRCDKCFALFYDGYADKGVCPAGGAHRAGQSFSYLLRYDAPARMNDQSAWRYCDKCHAMFYDGYPNKGKCPAGGGHRAQGYNFTLPHDIPDSERSRATWRYCEKCHAMFDNGQATKGSCSAGGAHSAQGYEFVLRFKYGA